MTTPTQTKLTRRKALMSGFAASVVVAQPAWALSEAQARKLVDAVVRDINAVINSGKSEAGMIADFEQIFGRYADVPIMARYALGVESRTATKAQMTRFTKAFSGYISRKYDKRFREFIGGKIEVKSARAINAGYEIRCTAFLRGESPFEVTFLVSGKSGQDKFFNMFIEGINLLLTERTEIGALLDRRGGNIDQLTADLAKL